MTAPHECPTCKGYGFIPWQRGQTPEQFEQGCDDCPDCTPPASQPLPADSVGGEG